MELVVNLEQARLFAGWPGWRGRGADSASSVFFCLDGPIDLKLGITVDSIWQNFLILRKKWKKLPRSWSKC